VQLQTAAAQHRSSGEGSGREGLGRRLSKGQFTSTSAVGLCGDVQQATAHRRHHWRREEFDKRRRAAVSWSTWAGRRCRQGRVMQMQRAGASVRREEDPALSASLPWSRRQCWKQARGFAHCQMANLARGGAETASLCGDVWRARTENTNERAGGDE
jgi:hypothetical protein